MAVWCTMLLLLKCLSAVAVVDAEEKFAARGSATLAVNWRGSNLRESVTQAATELT